MFALASQFDKDSTAEVPGAVRCGFEAEFASSEQRQQVAERIATILDIPVKSVNVAHRHGASHGGDYTRWSVEADGSIPTDREHPVQVEVVSPIMEFSDMLESMQSIFSVIEDIGKTSQTAGESTGLHITFSSSDIDLGSLDVLKLVLLLGEHYYAKMFGREDATYAERILARLSEPLGSTHITGDDIKAHIANPTQGRIHDLVSAEMVRQLSVNITKAKRGIIEFRLLGGDSYEYSFHKTAAIARRFVHALYAACDPRKYVDVYAKKLSAYIHKSVDSFKDEERRAGTIYDASSIRAVRDSSGDISLTSLRRTPAGIKKVELADLELRNGVVVDIHFGLNLEDATVSNLLELLINGYIKDVPTVDAITLLHMYSSRVAQNKPVPHYSSLIHRIEMYISNNYGSFGSYNPHSLDEILSDYYRIASDILGRYSIEDATPMLHSIIEGYVAGSLHRSRLVDMETVKEDPDYIKYVLPVVDAYPEELRVLGAQKGAYSGKSLRFYFKEGLSIHAPVVSVVARDDVAIALAVKSGRPSAIAECIIYGDLFKDAPDIDSSVFKSIPYKEITDRRQLPIALTMLGRVANSPRMVFSQYLRKANPKDIKGLVAALLEKYKNNPSSLGSSWLPSTGIPAIDKVFKSVFDAMLTAARAEVAQDGVAQSFMLDRYNPTIKDIACLEVMTKADLEQYISADKFSRADLDLLTTITLSIAEEAPLPKNDAVYDFAIKHRENLFLKLSVYSRNVRPNAVTLGRGIPEWYRDIFSAPVRLAVTPDIKKRCVEKLSVCLSFYARNLPVDVFYSDDLYAFLSALPDKALTRQSSSILLGLFPDAIPGSLFSNPAFLYVLRGFKRGNRLDLPDYFRARLPSDIDARVLKLKKHPTVRELARAKAARLKAANEDQG